MRIYDVIAKKRDGQELSKEEIHFFISAYVKGDVADYQMSAFLMAVFLRGLGDEELAALTWEMAQSGTMIDLSSIQGMKVDKHSTGGVGDKTTFIIAPLVAACGGKVAKMSGRGLGHTGGTIDKMESIPGMRSTLSDEVFCDIVNRVGFSIMGQSQTLAPADQKMYALRDVTGTVESIPLIASSVMSKKLAAGSDAIVLDVKVGSGAFMKTLDEAVLLGQKMVSIGAYHGKEMIAFITDMDRPLGMTIGNALEIREVVDTLRGKGPADLTEESIMLASTMLHLCRKGTMEECTTLVTQALYDGRGLERFRAMIEAQGGQGRIVDDVSLLPIGTHSTELRASRRGFITRMNAQECGVASLLLGAGRVHKDDAIDYGAGIVMHKKTGDAVDVGDILATFYTNRKHTLEEAVNRYEQAILITEERPSIRPSILARISSGGVEYYV